MIEGYKSGQSVILHYYIDTNDHPCKVVFFWIQKQNIQIYFLYKRYDSGTSIL